MIIFNNDFEIGEIVYCRTDPTQLPMILTGFVLDGISSTCLGIKYVCSQGNDSSCYYGYEISRERTTDWITKECLN